MQTALAALPPTGSGNVSVTGSSAASGGDLTGSGTASASGYYNTGYEADKAFDNSTSTADGACASGGCFLPWIETIRKDGPDVLRGFVQGLRRDYAAVKAALTVEWSNGQTEGQVNRLKLIKRQMYGRANFDLLRLRVLG